MLVQTFAALMGAAAVFFIAAALRGDKRFLVPAGGIILITGAMLGISGSFQIPDGLQESGTTVINTTTANEEIRSHNMTETTEYRDIAAEYPSNIAHLLAILLLITGTGVLFIGANLPPLRDQKRM